MTNLNHSRLRRSGQQTFVTGADRCGREPDVPCPSRAHDLADGRGRLLRLASAAGRAKSHEGRRRNDEAVRPAAPQIIGAFDGLEVTLTHPAVKLREPLLRPQDHENLREGVTQCARGLGQVGRSQLEAVSLGVWGGGRTSRLPGNCESANRAHRVKGAARRSEPLTRRGRFAQSRQPGGSEG